ncbi:MAG: phage baseplate protein [Faecalibacterium sp.]
MLDSLQAEGQQEFLYPCRGGRTAEKRESFPVGSIYQSTDPTSPAALFGGSWEEIASERVLMGASSTHAAGTTVKAGLPNITGTLSDVMGSFYAYPSGSGAFFCQRHRQVTRERV